jgi:iron complex transport system substrate-binding protein
MRTCLLAAVVVLLSAGGYWAGRWANEAAPVASGATPQRIVSTAPNLTEILFALGVGDRVVGVTPYCNHPPEARDLPKIGGLLDPNFEALVALEPDLIVLLRSAEHHRPALERLGLRTLVVPHRNLEGMLQAIEMLGTAVGREEEARRTVADFRGRLERVAERVAGRGRPRVLLVIERDYSAGLASVTVAAANASYDLYDRVIEIAGGKNACPQSATPFPPVSTEGLLWMNPEVIVELVPPAAERSLDVEAIRRQWQELPELEAVKNVRVHVIDDDFAMIPGPRFVRLVEKLAELLHPEVEWDDARDL